MNTFLAKLTKPPLTKPAEIFEEIVTGTLIYAVLMGFFADYTSLLYSSSYSITFLAALVMESMTLAILQSKAYVAGWFRARSGQVNQALMILSLWLILFLSKFVMLEVLVWLFAPDLTVPNFWAVMIIILTMTVVKRLIDAIYNRLAEL